MFFADEASTPKPERYPTAPGHRKTDTSKAAADAMKPSAANLRDLALAQLRRRPQTSWELSLSLKLPFESIQPRTSELQALGLIEDSGVRGPARSPNRTAIRWQLVQKAAAA